MARPRALAFDPSNRLQNIARLVQMKGWTQTELATRSGLATAYVNQLLTGRKQSPTLDVLDTLASTLQVSSAVLIDQRLSDAELHTELSQGALRAALSAGISHPKFSRFPGTPEAPVTVDGWQQLARILEIAEAAPRSRGSGRVTRSPRVQRKQG